jgi:hypothetical protein
MAITIRPNTGEDHLGFTHDERSYIVYYTLGPALAELADGTEPDPSLIDAEMFVPGDTRLHVTSIERAPSDGSFVVYVDEIPSELTLTPREVATIAAAIPSGR